MKQLIAVILCVSLLLAGCGASTEPNPDEAQQPQTSAAPAQQPAAEAAGQPLTGLPREGEAQRPVAVMVNNAPGGGLRQWGLGSASVIVEALTEGENTNWMLWFDRLADVPKVGPVAEAKDVFWQLALPMNSILVQKGMNSYAENLLNCYGVQPLDALMLGVNSFDYDGSDPAMPVEFSWYTQGTALQYGVDHYQMPLTGSVPAWQTFGTPAAGQPAASVTVQFSAAQSTTLRAEDGLWGLYRTDGTQQLDANDGQPVRVNNVVILQAKASVKDNKFTREYDLTGGDGLYLVDGAWQPIHWQKGDVASPLTLTTPDGAPLQLAAGKTYLAVTGDFDGQSVTVLAADGTVVYPAAPQAPAEG